MGVDVSLVPCASYDPAECRRALTEVLAPLGGLDWVRPGMRVAIKANLVAPMRPEAAATTHPALLAALTGLLRERGATVVIGDSPGGLWNAAYVGRVYAAAGMRAAEEAGAFLNDDFSWETVQNPSGMVCHEFPCTSYLRKADAVIDFCKFKTHGMIGFSAAAKNLFGAVPGTMKPEFHFRYPNPADFARMIVDLDEFFRPRLCLTDAVVGMEGNGPTAGTPRQVGALLASASPHQLDLLSAALIGLSRKDVPTLEAAGERGLIPASAEELNVAGDWRAFRIPDYRCVAVPSSLLFRGGSVWGKFRGSLIQRLICPRPAVDASVCVGCGKCRSLCPANAIRLENGVPVIARKRCIRCFCCQEFCPKGAMRVIRPPAARLLSR